MKPKRSFCRVITCLLAIILSLGALAPLAFAADSEELDLSVGGSQYTETLNSYDLLSGISTVGITELEREYLVAFGKYSLKYDSGITTASIHTSFDESEGSLEVSAYEHSYLSDTGKTVVWRPLEAELDGISKPLSYDGNGSYIASFTKVDSSDSEAIVNVTYSLDLLISEDTANELLNLAYTDAVYYKELIATKEEEYREALDAYNREHDRFLAYLDELEKYNDDKALFDAYSALKAAHDKEVAAFKEYCALVAEHKLQSELFQKYQEDMEKFKADMIIYQDYLEKVADYKLKKDLFDKAEADLLTVRNQLAGFELIKLPMSSLSRTVYNAIMGGLVDQVLAERDTLESNIFGAPPLVISMAGDATVALRNLMTDYYALETETARYTYYTANYEAIRDNFVKLFIALDCLYSNGRVRAVLIQRDKNEKYKILVAQLYVVATALSDTPVKSVDPSLVANSIVANRFKRGFTYDGNFYLEDNNRKYNELDILGKTYFVDENKATPLTTGFPTLPDKPTEPDYMAEPKRPTSVAPPGDLPDEVTEPGDPPSPVIPDPGDPPEEVTDPTPPVEYEPDPIVSALVSELGKTILERNEDFSRDAELRLTKTVGKRFLNVEEVDVIFLDRDGSILYMTTVDKGSAAGYVGSAPTRPEDPRASYTFDGWMTSDGVRVDLSCINSDLTVYPFFKENLKQYKIKWVVNGVETEELYYYNSIPSYKLGTPQKPSDSENIYSFAGWDKELLAVTGDAVYTATFRANSIISSDDKISVAYDESSGYYLIDAHSSFKTSFDLSVILPMADGKAGILLNTRFASVDIPRETVTALTALDASEIDIIISQTASRRWSYSVLFRDSDKLEVGNGLKVSLSSSPYIGERGRMAFYKISDSGERISAAYRISASKLIFEAEVGARYLFGYLYSVDALSTSSVTLSVPEGLYLSGDTVEIGVEVQADKRLEDLYYVNAEGERISLFVHKGKTTLTVPDVDVMLTPESQDLYYVITFKSLGATITTLYCKPGELPPEPEAPRRPNDSEYSYTFSGWSEKIIPANGDKTYFALFEKTPLVTEAEDTGLSIYQTVLLIGSIFAALALGTALTLTIVTVVRSKRRF